MVAADTVVSPTYLPDLADATLDLLVDGERGIWHLANAGEVTWAQLAADAASHAGLDTGLIRPVPMRRIAGPAPRPAYSVLDTSAVQHDHGIALRPWRDALSDFLARCGRETPIASPRLWMASIWAISSARKVSDGDSPAWAIGRVAASTVSMMSVWMRSRSSSLPSK